MCIYLDGLRASSQVKDCDEHTLFGLVSLPSYGKTKFLRHYLSVVPKNSIEDLLKSVAEHVFYGDLISRLSALPEDAGKGLEAVAVFRKCMVEPVTEKDIAEEEAPKSIYHQMLELDGLSREVTLAVIALNSRRIRRTCLDWYKKNADPNKGWQNNLLYKLAGIVQEDDLIDYLEARPLTESGASEGVAYLSDVLGKSKPSLLPVFTSGEGGCCSG